MTEDTELYEFLAEGMGLPFPFCPRPDFRKARGCTPPSVYPDAVAELSALAIGVYCKIHSWRVANEHADFDRVAHTVGDPDAASAALHELFHIGCLLNPDEAARRSLYRGWLYSGESESAAARKERRGIKAPQVWPDYTAEEWRGDLNTVCDQYARLDTPVVYFLFNADDELIYIGSTDNLWGRLRSHAMDKPWFRFLARGCPDRESAFWLEAGEVKVCKPPLNRDLTVNGRVRHVPKGFVPSVPLTLPLALPVPRT